MTACATNAVGTADAAIRQQLLGDDDLLTIDQTARICSPPGQQACRASVYRWAKIGIKVAPDRRVRLTTTKLPKGSMVKAKDLREFLRQLQSAETGMVGTPGRRSRAEEALDSGAKVLVGPAN